MPGFTIRLSLAIACFSLAGLASTSGQNAPAATQAAAPAAPSATPAPSPIALADVVTEAQSVSATLREQQTGLNPDQITRVIDENLPILTRQIDESVAEDDRLLDASPSLSSLQSSQGSRQSLANGLAGSEKALSGRATQVSGQITQLDQLNKTWQATLESAKKAAAPPAVVRQIQAVLAMIADTARAAQADQAQILSEQARVAAQEARINAALDVIAKAMATARDQLFEQDHPPLWRAEAASQAGAGIVTQEKVSIHAQVEALKTYLKDKVPAVLIHLLLFALLAVGLYWIRNAIRSHAEEEATLHHAARVFDVPLATALLLAILVTRWLYPQAPPLLLAFAGAIALIPAIIIVRRLIDPANFSLLYAAVIAYFVDQLRYVVRPAGILSRLLFVLELLAASIFLLTAICSKRPAGRLRQFTRIYLDVAFFIFVFACLANVFGYVHLSFLIGAGMLKSSYLAIIFYAAVRIADGLAFTALSIRPLATLGMVRRHRDMIYGNIAASIRWLAFALWLLAALQLFTLRAPLWQEASRLLDTNLPWFSIKVPIRSILAFPITVWAAFLFSRFVRFALEEEVYPHLQLARGISYAASAMVHYTILLLGFFAAVAATGAQLSQFAFLAGAFGVGLGFGLQNIMNNFVSGVILLFERPIKVGDIIQINTDVGKVERIGIRASVILLANGSELIVPNGNLISNPVTNWTLSNCDRLIEIPVNVAPKADPQQVLKLLTDVARADPRVLKNPPPQALLVTFGATALAFQLRAWTNSEEEWMKITSDLSLAVNSALAGENIAMS